MYLKGVRKTVNILNETTITLESRSVNEGYARTAVAAFLSQLDPLVSEISDIKTAVSEAVTNCVVHAYKNSFGKIRINVRIMPDNVIVIRIIDRGCGIEDIHKAMQPLFTTSPEEERAGLGFAVMQSFCDAVSVRSAVGKGTTVTLRKKLSLRYGNV